MKQLHEALKELPDDQAIKFSKLFLPEWIRMGFGALTKKDTEVLIFCCLEAILSKKPNNNYEWAKMLKITPQKVKSLKLEGYLKYPIILNLSDPEELLMRCFNTIEHISFAVPEGHPSNACGDIKILIEDPIISFELDRKMKDLGGSLNFERNRELIKFEFKDFLLLIDKIMGSGETHIINNIITKKIETNKTLNEIQGKLTARSYAQKSDKDKLISFLELCGDAFAEKPTKLIKHLRLIFESQKK